MTKRCQLTKKRPVKGKTYTTRGIAKKNKGIGLNITGSCKRRFQPNLIKKRFWFEEENRYVTLRVSAHGMRIIDKKGLGAMIRQMRAQGEKI
ncbi:MAG: 50S ribosomal protein L28 [Simkaniaceae bacterium]|nr:50S ribosomal protein L28 [Simkaniaceae bacterium]